MQRVLAGGSEQLQEHLTLSCARSWGENEGPAQVGTILKLFCQHIISVRIRGGAETQLNFTLFIPSILTFTLKISNAHLTTVQDIDIIFGFEGRKISILKIMFTLQPLVWYIITISSPIIV